MINVSWATCSVHFPKPHRIAASPQELNFLYDQDVALNAAEPLMDVEDPSEEEEILVRGAQFCPDR